MTLHFINGFNFLKVIAVKGKYNILTHDQESLNQEKRYHCTGK